ncbi:hypothetical protein NKJ36_16910 [Mesorhizobium sp. M0142]|uniref:hypothetical protein n=1 Tax=unclassified Mesorhizobium TaxID=325217 RepID=UPI003338B8BB
MDVFDSAIRTKGDLAGVFEYDEADDPNSATAYFYLCRTEDGAGRFCHRSNSHSIGRLGYH